MNTMETWIDFMETLFEYLYTLERDKVHLAAHYLKKSARVWWKGIKRADPSVFLWSVGRTFEDLYSPAVSPKVKKKKLQE